MEVLSMSPRMSYIEAALLESCLRCSEIYVEFGTGGSTVLASQLVKRTIISVDSSKEWQNRVAVACEGKESITRPDLILADIGPTREWGYPVGSEDPDSWCIYYTDVWKVRSSRNADLFLIDGRFRVACFLETLRRCMRDSVILFHDFTSRPDYHVVHEVAREVAKAGDLSLFLRRPGTNDTTVGLLLDAYKHNPA
jgi:hypothetical protein